MSTSPLTERLLARANEPLGLIDVRAARAHYERIMEWVAARLALVEQLRARYGLTEDDAWGELAFAVTPGQMRGDESFDSVGDGATKSYDLTHTISSVDITRATTAEGTTRVPESLTSMPATHETVRIGRRGAPVFSQLDRVTDAREDVPTHERKRGDAESHGVSESHDASETTTRPMPLSPSRPSTPTAESSASSSSASSSSVSSPSSEESITSSDEHTTPAPERREMTLARTAEVSASAAESSEAHKAPASEARKAPEASAPIETANPLPLKESANTRAPKVVEASPKVVEAATRAGESSHTLSSSHTPSTRVVSPSTRVVSPPTLMVSPHPADLPLATPAHALPASRELQSNGPAEAAAAEAVAKRATEGKESGAETGATTKAVETSAVRGGSPPRARAKEIASVAVGHESLTYSTQSPLPLAASRGDGASAHAASPTQQHAFAESGAQAFKSLAGGVEAETYSAAREQKTRAAEVNVGRLAEQVSRHLARRLLVERERRGMK
jgi:hypothetical protein